MPIPCAYAPLAIDIRIETEQGELGKLGKLGELGKLRKNILNDLFPNN